MARLSTVDDSRSRGVTFAGKERGSWQVDSMTTIRGPSLPQVAYVEVIPGVDPQLSAGSVWTLRGIIQAEHYATPTELGRLRSRQPELGRPSSTLAALIPIRKSPDWWSLPTSERRAIFEDRSHHIATGLDYLPAVARQLYHSRDYGEPYDFLTWFEFAPSVTPAFNQLLRRLRSAEEWGYVDSEVEIRLHRPSPGRPSA